MRPRPARCSPYDRDDLSADTLGHNSPTTSTAGTPASAEHPTRPQLPCSLPEFVPLSELLVEPHCSARGRGRGHGRGRGNGYSGYHMPLNRLISSAGCHAESVGGAEQVTFDGAHRHGEPVSDLTIGQAVRGERDDFALASGERYQGAVGAQRRCVGAGLVGEASCEGGGGYGGAVRAHLRAVGIREQRSC